MHKSGHWFIHPEGLLQPKANALVDQVMKALDGVVDGVMFEAYGVTAQVFGKDHILSVAKAIQATKALQLALDCPLRFVSLQPQALRLHVLHPLFEEGQMPAHAVTYNPGVPVEDWIQGILA